MLEATDPLNTQIQSDSSSVGTISDVSDTDIEQTSSDSGYHTDDYPVTIIFP